MGAFYADWRQRDVSFQKVKVSFLTQKYEKHIRVPSLSVEIVCFTTLNNSMGPRNFLRKLGEVAPLNFQREKLRTSLLQQAIGTCLNAVFFHVKSHEQWLLVSIS